MSEAHSIPPKLVEFVATAIDKAQVRADRLQGFDYDGVFTIRDVSKPQQDSKLWWSRDRGEYETYLRTLKRHVIADAAIAAMLKWTLSQTVTIEEIEAKPDT